jgi:polyisoprenoid-binding protein YceI
MQNWGIYEGLIKSAEHISKSTVRTRTKSKQQTMKKINTLIALLLVGGATFAQTSWNVDKSHSNVQFTVTHNVISEVSGVFKDYNATITSKGEDFTNGGDVEFVVKTASVDTENENRDKHLRSDDFFNAEQYPDMTFKGAIVKDGAKFVLKGNLTIRDVTKPVTFDAAYLGSIDTGRGGIRAGWKVAGKVNRLDYGLKWSNKLASGEYVVADEVQLLVKLELIKVVPGQAGPGGPGAPRQGAPGAGTPPNSQAPTPRPN